MRNNIQKLSVASLFVSIAVVGSLINFPIFNAKCAPIQHIVNILSGVILGPFWAVGCALVASLLRNILGIGTLFAFPGSIFGAFLAGFFYKNTNKLFFAYMGEVFGTSIIGALCAYPIALFVMKKEVGAFAFVLPFLISSGVGTVIAIFVTQILRKRDII